MDAATYIRKAKTGMPHDSVALAIIKELEADARWRHDWHERLGRGEAETEGAFYSRIEALVHSRFENSE